MQIDWRIIFTLQEWKAHGYIYWKVKKANNTGHVIYTVRILYRVKHGSVLSLVKFFARCFMQIRTSSLESSVSSLAIKRIWSIIYAAAW